jgi:hypothetical protein
MTVDDNMDEPLTLFPAEAYRPSKNFLTRNARFYECLIASKTLREKANIAAKVAQQKAGAGRNSAALFEEKFKELLLEPSAVEQIAVETLEHANSVDPELNLRHVTITSGKGTALADIVVTYETDNSGPVAIATNIKRLQSGRTSTESGSIPQMIQLALEDTYDPSNPPSPIGFDWQRALVEWYARRRKIKDGRDYWLLIARVNEGKCSALEAWGALSGKRKNGISIGRHPSRAVVMVSAPAETIGQDVDINAKVASALLPSPSASALRALLVAVAEQKGGPDLAMPLAARLLDMDDATLFASVLKAFKETPPRS